MSAAHTICVLDDEPGLVKAITRLLKAEGYAVRGFTSAAEFFAAPASQPCDCLVLDVAMPELDGFAVQERLKQSGCVVPIIFLTGRGDIPMSVHAIKAGAVDFLTKPVHDADLLRAVREALGRGAVERKQAAVVEALRQRYALLTPREREVMGHVVAGRMNKVIAADLGTGEQNIKVHRGRVMEKMGVESLADLVRAAGRLGLGKE
jgi:FixJ family two-component response regulator